MHNRACIVILSRSPYHCGSVCVFQVSYTSDGLCCRESSVDVMVVSYSFVTVHLARFVVVMTCLKSLIFDIASFTVDSISVIRVINV